MQAALTVIGRRDPERDVHTCDLRGAILVRADATLARLAHADLTGATLTGATLVHADLTPARLTRALLSGARLNRARLNGADLTGADLTSANLTGALWSADRISPPGWTPEEGSARLRRAGSPAVRGDTSDVLPPGEAETT